MNSNQSILRSFRNGNSYLTSINFIFIIVLILLILLLYLLFINKLSM